MSYYSRSHKILLGLINHYIETGRPVSSSQLQQVLKLDVSPATVRNHLHELEEEGYIYQPHTSAGRIPTDKGYRFFVNRMQRRALAAAERRKIERNLSAILQAHHDLTRSLAHLLAQISGTAAITAQMTPLDMQESGFRDLVHSSKEQTLSLDHLKEVSMLIDKLDSIISRSKLPKTQETTSFIGNEIPFMPAKYSSVIMRSANTADGQEVTLILIGSKRMPYQRHSALMDTIANIIQEP